jgi:hypothetical protein
MPRGHDSEPKVRFLSTHRSEFNEKNHRRISKSTSITLEVDNRELKPVLDYVDYTKFVNNQFSR